MTIREVIQRVQNLYSKGTPSDDTRLSDRHIYNKLITVRSKLLSQEINRKKIISPWSYQTIPCIELIEVSTHECECLPLVGCNILRSKYKIPKPLVSYSRHFIESVTSIEGSIEYKPVRMESRKYKKGNKYTSNTLDYYIKNEYIYISYKEGPRVIAVTGIFEDPVEVNSFPSYCGNDAVDVDCTSPLDTEFPMELDMIDTTIEMTFNELINIFNQTIEDTSNNSKDSPAERSK